MSSAPRSQGAYSISCSVKNGCKFSAGNGYKLMVANFTLYMVADKKQQNWSLAKNFIYCSRWKNEKYIMNGENMNKYDTIYTNGTSLSKCHNLNIKSNPWTKVVNH